MDFALKVFLRISTVEPLLRGHVEERPTSLERPLVNINSNCKVLIFTSDERLPLLKPTFFGENRVASQEGFHCVLNV